MSSGFGQSQQGVAASSPRQCRLTSLPREVASAIFDYGSVRELSRVAATCRMLASFFGITSPATTPARSTVRGERGYRWAHRARQSMQSLQQSEYEFLESRLAQDPGSWLGIERGQRWLLPTFLALSNRELRGCVSYLEAAVAKRRVPRDTSAARAETTAQHEDEAPPSSLSSRPPAAAPAQPEFRFRRYLQNADTLVHKQLQNGELVCTPPAVSGLLFDEINRSFGIVTAAALGITPVESTAPRAYPADAPATATNVENDDGQGPSAQPPPLQIHVTGTARYAHQLSDVLFPLSAFDENATIPPDPVSVGPPTASASASPLHDSDGTPATTVAGLASSSSAATCRTPLYSAQQLQVYAQLLTNSSVSLLQHYESSYHWKNAVVIRLVGPGGGTAELRYFHTVRLGSFPCFRALLVWLPPGDAPWTAGDRLADLYNDDPHEAVTLFKCGYGRVELDIRPWADPRAWRALAAALGVAEPEETQGEAPAPSETVGHHQTKDAVPLELLWNAAVVHAVGNSLTEHSTYMARQYQLSIREALRRAFTPSSTE